MPLLTRRGAANVTTDLDKIANLFQNRFASLGVPAKIAQDFAYRCDLLSDHIEKFAGRRAEDETGLSEPALPDTFDANLIGDEVEGPLDTFDLPEVEEEWMGGHFTQERFQALREKQEDGELEDNAADGVADARLASQVRRLTAQVRRLTARLAGEADAEAEDEAEEAESAASKKASARLALRRRRAGEAEVEAEEEAESAASKKASARLLRRLLAEEAEADAEAGEDEAESESDEAASKKAFDFLARKPGNSNAAGKHRPWGSTGCSPGIPSSGKANQKKYHAKYDDCYADLRENARARIENARTASEDALIRRLLAEEAEESDAEAGEGEGEAEAESAASKKAFARLALRRRRAGEDEDDAEEAETAASKKASARMLRRLLAEEADADEDATAASKKASTRYNLFAR